MTEEYPLVFKARVKSIVTPRSGYRWYGLLIVQSPNWKLLGLLMTGSIARWFIPGEYVRIESKAEPKPARGLYILEPGDYRLCRLTKWGEVLVWPVWRKEITIDKPYYKGRILVREAVSEEDYENIASLEQYHYASKEELVAVWKCPRCGTIVEANLRPSCPKCGARMLLQEIRGSLPSSRFLVLELLTRKSYEPKIIGYVRVDTPIPLMHRRIPQPDGTFMVEKLIREKIFPKDWFHPTFWPITGKERRKILRLYSELAPIYGKRLARTMVAEKVAQDALARANTAAARIARVVVHPDFRGGGLGVLAVKTAVEWIKERRIPEMKREKHVVETIAAMARYNPFFERAGFKYMWDTASGRPVLMYPLTETAQEYIRNYLESDPLGSQHKGMLYRPRYRPAPPLQKPIRLKGVVKSYRNALSLEGLPENVAEALRSFGVEKRIVERYVLRDVNLDIDPGTVNVLIGISGAGKTTLLRMIIGAVNDIDDPAYRPDEGEIEVPVGAKLSAYLPGELEPKFGDGSLLEEITAITGDVVEALEVLSVAGISDAVLYRAKVSELSTGQKERAKIAALLAKKPNIVIIDEFTAHLDPTTARWVAGRIAKMARQHGITLVLATHRREVLDALNPDKLIQVGYGGIKVITREEL
ncbi:MAG: GNAT family N-acetyltransferase [Desulfurococcales archaeon]|nr:GNAT family N-acetyltransferase [Desulfurococcales archaeon]